MWTNLNSHRYGTPGPSWKEHEGGTGKGGDDGV